ncbi:MAG: hypothetical protein F6K19_26010 [Cyanothece sp. SIO1E1]|nr:hypothetical protein [Cyanothece sp. SIO1E1]
MAYSDFSLASVQEAFELTIDESSSLFADVKGVPPSAFLTQALTEYLSLATAIGTEKARSEFLIAPVLAEVRRQLSYKIALFSGTEFNVDKDLGLQGFCDFLICDAKEQLFISTPVVILIEAKREDIISGLGQCVATMLGAQLFNQRKQNPVDIIYGCVTSGTNWRFLTLQDRLLRIDSVEYYIKEIDQLLGIFLQPFQAALSAIA